MLHLDRFGPLIHYWCMRMKAKNAYVKKATNRGNFNQQFPHLRLFAGGGRVKDCGDREDVEGSWESFEEPAGLEHEGNGQVTSLLSEQNVLVFS